MTSAYNILLDVEKNADGTPGFALWHIWPPWSSTKLDEYMLKNGLAPADSGSPVHGQRVYLNEKHIQEMSAIAGLKPFTIHQRKGDVVFIPGNCAHQVRGLNGFIHFIDSYTQVSNNSDCIKYARDFLCPMQLAEVCMVQEELRQHRILYGGLDVLQFHQTLWFGWLSLSERLRRTSELSASEIAVPLVLPFGNVTPRQMAHSPHLHQDSLEEALLDVDHRYVRRHPLLL